jgi:nucleoside-diphosphate-sugar epimerase
MNQHLIIGAGPVGAGIATALAATGQQVTILTRSGTGPDHAAITKVRGSAADAATLTTHATGALTIYNCANPPYHQWPVEWPPMHVAMMTAAERTGAVLVMMDNLYAVGPGATMPMTEASPSTATEAKGAVRALMARQLLEAHAAGTLRATLARASDFYGPGVLGAALGERVVPRVIAGKKVTLLGKLDIPHVVSYMPDVITTMVTIGADERAWGKQWQVPNAPAVSQRDTVNAFAKAAGTTAKVAAAPRIALRAMGVFNPMMKALLETWYQFDQPWTTDSSLTEQTFGLTATPLNEGAAATVAWWRQQGAS